MTRSLEKALHRERAFASHELIELAHDFPADSLGTKDHTADRGGDEEHWRDCKQRVVSKGCTEAECIVVPPGPERSPE